MHLLIPHAGALSPACAQTLSGLALPNLGRLLARLETVATIEGDEYELDMPHERVLARSLGLRGEDGELPWGAHRAAADGIEVGERAWGLLTPVHWQVGRDAVTLADPARLELDADESRALFERVRDLFESEGFGWHWGAPLRWYASHDCLERLPCASLDRVIGRNVDLWLESGAAHGRPTGLARRLQNEVQMLLYTDPLTDAREARGRLPVNTFWLSGCGRHQAATGAPPQVDSRLREPLLNQDWADWADAWRALDAGPLADLLAALERGEAVELTLCGERHARTLGRPPRSLLGSLRRRFQTVETGKWLEQL